MTENTTASGAADTIFQAMADRAYCNYIEQLRRDECLGWEHKVKTGKFGEVELKAHKKAADFLGAHRAFSEAAKLIAASAPVAPAPITEAEQAAWHAGIDEGRSQVRALLQQGEYLPLPIGEGTVYCNPDGSLMIDASLAFFDGAKIGDKLYTADQVCAAIDADRAARGAAQAAAPAHISAMERAWLWMENQSDAQSKGCHETFDLMMLRDERDALREAIDTATAAPSPVAEDAEDGARFRAMVNAAFTGFDAFERIMHDAAAETEPETIDDFRALIDKARAQAAQPEGGEPA